MAAQVIKEPSRPIVQHRPSFSSGQSLLPRNSLPRTHPYSSSLGSLNPIHRITRRKSSTLTPAAINAAVQAIESKDGVKRAMPGRSISTSLTTRTHLSPPNSLPQGSAFSGNDSAIIDGPPLASILEKPASKNRIRRASDGSTLSGKKKSGHGDLKCETCGKGYKHSSCLTKHLWEHTPEWAITSKLLISKHQQVQLLEAASVLVAMNAEGPEHKSSDSEQSYESPPASGSDDREDSVSSIETSPPPQGDRPYGHHKRLSTVSSGYSRSYQSTFSHSDRHHGGHARQYSDSSYRFAPDNQNLEDQADLAAAVGLLSCSIGTPQTAPLRMGEDVPPVPPLPEKYQSVPRHSHIRDTDMGNAESSDDESRRPISRHEEDDRIFGEMDE